MTRYVVRLSNLLLIGLLAIGLAACGGSTAAPTAVPVAPVATDTPPPAPTATPAEAPPPAEAEQTNPEELTSAEEEGTAPAQPLIFTIDPASSEARFFIDEVLRGIPTTVVGVTSLVNGTITTNPADLSQTAISTIQIDASNLTTDSDMRNSAIRRFVLQTTNEAYRYITFEPTAIEGLPAAAQPGDQFTFSVSGNLKIRDIVQPVTFAVEATATSDAEIRGQAVTTVTREAYQLTIPSVPSVANVSNEVKLELDFVARAQ
jgi:polyisoprenoid-binding protein YceI